MSRKGKRIITLMLPDIRSEHNIGAMFRTADALGISEIILSGHSPLPVDRFGRKNSGVTKTSLGAEESVPWRFVKNTQRAISAFKKEGFCIIAIEQGKDSVDYKKVNLPKKNTVFILGNEVKGLPRNILKYADKIVEIPMRGQKESLNVSVAMGVALFRILNI